jgi:hypothetical protein
MGVLQTPGREVWNRLQAVQMFGLSCKLFKVVPRDGYIFDGQKNISGQFSVPQRSEWTRFMHCVPCIFSTTLVLEIRQLWSPCEKPSEELHIAPPGTSTKVHNSGDDL